MKLTTSLKEGARFALLGDRQADHRTIDVVVGEVALQSLGEVADQMHPHEPGDVGPHLLHKATIPSLSATGIRPEVRVRAAVVEQELAWPSVGPTPRPPLPGERVHSWSAP